MVEAKKTWYKRWWAITLFIIVGLVILSSIFGGNKADVWSKSSGYTVDECYEICDGTYDIQLQVTVCQGNCDMFGKPSASLDKYVDTVKDIKNKKG